ncbi:MAG: PKD domain-containing protein [Ferruginibacter sp.]
MKKILLSIFFITSVYTAFATHTKGGWMYYEYLGPGLNDPTKLRYRIGLIFYTSCNNGIAETGFNISIFENTSPFNLVQDAPVSIVGDNNIQNCTLTACYPCLDVIPSICYWVRNFQTTVELAPSANGYILSKQRCCRVNLISNLVDPSNAVGETYSINIPGFNTPIPNAHINSSPQFIFNDTAIVCGNNLMSINFGATDADGDSLVYTFCNAFDGGDNAGNANPLTASAPPYSSVPYLFPYSGTRPLGAAVTINAVTGIISGIAPPPGEYVVTVCVAEFRNGVHFADSKKELHLRVAACSPVVATLDPEYTTCGDLTLAFFNQTDNIAIQNWFWQFGDPASGTNDSSVAQFPVHTFTVAGDYTIKLIVNRGLPCVDSTEQVVHVFPGFFPGFFANAPFCVGQPVQFNDTTRTNYGFVSNWSWNFGNLPTLADTSHLQNPTYTYTSTGTYNVQLVSGNSKGCKDTINHDVIVLATPALSLLPNDTSFCGLDSLQLTATGTGSFSWAPGTNIIGGNTATPTVFPAIPTKYVVTIDLAGCKNRDSVTITPLNDLTNAINANPAAICQEDTLTLTGSSNKTTNVSWQWSPAATLQSPTSQVTRAYPLATTNYTLTTRWGAHCIATKTLNIPVTPLAVPNAGPDSSYCTGQSAIPLSAIGGVSYQWTPSAGLSNPNIANPLASPAVTTQYIVAVGVAGCSRTKKDTVLVTVRPKPVIAITNDTLICSIDTLQLNASAAGATSIIWTPNYNINNTTIGNPLASPDLPTTYHVHITDTHGCFKDDSVFVDVKLVVTVNAGPDTSICKSEGFKLKTTSDALHYLWTPSNFLSSDTAKNPFANPPVTTTYLVTANIGKCQSQDQVKIKVAPYPAAFAGNDTAVCIGFNTQITATGGSSYTWSPAIYLSNPSIATPLVIQPTSNIVYTVSVRDTLGCTKVIKDSVLVKVIQQLQVDAGPADTSIVEGETIRLNATGASTYLWNPGTWLSSTNIGNPLSAPDDNIKYYVLGTDQYGCIGKDSINIRLFRLDPDMYVPTAFTPNGDGNNDVTRPILLGMKALNYFKVFNRFGELMFSTTEKGKGWDGVYKGKPQDPATFVWMAEGVTFKGQKKTKKGYVVLIR